MPRVVRPRLGSGGGRGGATGGLRLAPARPAAIWAFLPPQRRSIHNRIRGKSCRRGGRWLITRVAQRRARLRNAITIDFFFSVALLHCDQVVYASTCSRLHSKYVGPHFRVRIDNVVSFSSAARLSNSCETYETRAYVREADLMPQQYREPAVIRCIGDFGCRMIANITSVAARVTRIFFLRPELYYGTVIRGEIT